MEVKTLFGSSDPSGTALLTRTSSLQVIHLVNGGAAITVGADVAQAADAARFFKRAMRFCAFPRKTSYRPAANNAGACSASVLWTGPSLLPLYQQSAHNSPLFLIQLPVTPERPSVEGLSVDPPEQRQ